MLLNFDDVGPGPVLVLLHGFPFDNTMWSEQKSAIGSVYRVITPDLRGHGKSPAPEGIYPIDDMADDVVELLDALKIAEPIVLGGLSLGGYVALSIAARYRKRLRGMILMDTTAAADTPERAESREEQARGIEQTGSTAGAVAAMLPRLFSASTRERRAQVIEPVERTMLATVPRAVVGTLRGMAARPDRTEVLGRLGLPSLVIVGENDVITPPEEARQMADVLGNAAFVVVPDAGHLSPVENPAAVNAAILAFLQGLA